VTYFAAVFRNQAKYSFKRKIIGVVLIGIMFLMCVPSCKQERKPDSVLSEKEMVSVLTEIYLVEEKAGRMGISRDSVEEIFPKFRERVFSKMRVSDSSFMKSMDYYMAHPEKLERIYSALVDSLSFKAQATTVVDSAKKNNVLPN
jgi:hypothetical protein